MQRRRVERSRCGESITAEYLYIVVVKCDTWKTGEQGVRHKLTPLMPWKREISSNLHLRYDSLDSACYRRSFIYSVCFILDKNLPPVLDRKSTRLNSSHGYISYAVFCLKKKK